MKQSTRRKSTIIAVSMLSSYIVLYPLSTAIVLIFERHQFSFQTFTAYLIHPGHLYTGFMFMGIGLIIGLILSYFLSRQDSLNTELMEINNALFQSNSTLKEAVGKEGSDALVFLEGIRPTIRKIDDSLEDVSRFGIPDRRNQQQLEITKKNVRQIADLIDLITEREPGK